MEVNYVQKIYSMGYELRGLPPDNQVMSFFTLFLFIYFLTSSNCNDQTKQFLGSFNTLGKLHFIPFIYVLKYLFISPICSGKEPLNHFSYHELLSECPMLTIKSLSLVLDTITLFIVTRIAIE